MKHNFFIRYFLLLAAQILLCGYFHLTPYIMLSILPAMVLCIPTRIGTTPAMVIAFLSALAVDFLAEGLPGINALALVPVAFCRKTLCGLIFGSELLVREDSFSIAKYGALKVIFAISVVQALFLLVYLWADGGGARPLGFNLLRFVCSLAAGILLSVPVTHVLCPDDR